MQGNNEIVSASKIGISQKYKKWIWLRLFIPPKKFIAITNIINITQTRAVISKDCLNLNRFLAFLYGFAKYKIPMYNGYNTATIPTIGRVSR